MNKDSINYTTAHYILQYCIENFGLSRFKDYEIPNIKIHDIKPDKTKGFLKTDVAFFNNEKNCITIFKPNVKSFVDFIDSIIHEYTHYKQDLSNYDEMELTYGYYDHPMELEANKIASEHKWKCKDYVKNHIISKCQ
jgi:hypothetical protein